MRISSFHIDGFGIFNDVSVDDLAQGICIFLGRNEAGKSTCLEFLRTMLTGYPDPHNKKAARRPMPLRGGNPGGSLVLDIEGSGRLLITRRPGPGGGILGVSGPDGSARQPEDLAMALHGVSRDVYRSVFSFSLGELERFESLSSDAVRNALYGASFGAGIRAPAEVIRELDRRSDDFFKSGGSKPRLNTAVRELEELRARIDDIQTQCAGFDKLAADLAGKKRALADLRSQKSRLEEDLRQLERRLGVWRQWEEWHITGARLDRLEQVPESFPQDGPARLARLQEARESCERQLAASTQKLERLEQRLASMPIDEALLAHLPSLRRMAERKSSYRQALERVPAQTGICKRLEEDIKTFLNQLGPEWSLQRIHATDRSLFSREDLEKLAREMTAAELAHQADLNALARANREVENAEAAVRGAQEALSILPTPPSEVDENTRDEIRQGMARIEDMQRQLPQRARAVENARVTFARALEPLHIDRSCGEDAAWEKLDRLAGCQADALAVAADVQEKLKRVSDAAAAAFQAEEQADAVKKRMENLRESQRLANGPTRENLDRRSSALRALRALAAQLEAEQERIDDLDGRICSQQSPSSIKSVPLIAIGSTFMLLGAAIILAHTFLQMDNFILGAGLAVPVNLWSGYLVLACGVGFLAGGLPRPGPDAKRHANELAQLKSRRESCALHMAELGERAEQLREAVGVEKIDQVTLEATEVLLEREKEQFFQEEQTRREMNSLKREFEDAREVLTGRQTLLREAEANVQKARKRWHEFMQSLGVVTVPSPEGAGAFFAMATGAVNARDNIQAAEHDYASINSDLEQLLGHVAAIPVVARHLAPGDGPENICSAAQLVLDGCREADAAREQRIRAAAALQNHESARDLAQTRQEEISTQLDNSGKRLQDSREKWSKRLGALGIDDTLAPETVREAFKYMENCLAAEADLAAARAELANAKKELEALETPLAPIVHDFAPETERSGESRDWLALLDGLLNQAEDMARIKLDANRLKAQLEEERDTAKGHEAALLTARNREEALLATAHAADAEDFLRLAALRDERNALDRRREDLQDALKLAARDTPFDEFLSSFEEMEQAEQEQRCQKVRQALEELQSAEQGLATDVVNMGARAANLSQDDELARLRQQEELLLESMRRMAREWSANRVARSMLLRAKRKFEKERQPEVIRQASELFSRITGGKWRGLAASLENSSLGIVPLHGDPVDPDSLSRGAQEQAYLALRLAYILDHARHALALPIIMDDVLVNFDPERAENTIRALARMSSGDLPHQIFYFTCHPHMADILRASVPDAVLYEVQDGTIKRAQVVADD